MKTMIFYSKLNKLPIWNYWKVRETSELKYLVVAGDEEDYESLKVSDKYWQVLAAVWHQLNIDFIDEFGLSDELFNRLQAEKKLILLELENALNPRPILMSRIMHEKELLNNGVPTVVNTGISTFIAACEKFMGFQIDEKKTSVAKCYSYVKLMQEKQKSQEVHG